MGRARVGVPPGERRLRATHVERVGAAAVGCSAHHRPERLAGHEGAAWWGCGSGGVERTVVPRDRGRPEGAPEALSARAPRVRRPPWAPTSIARAGATGVAGVGWGGEVGGVGWKGGVVGLGCGYLPVAPIRAGLGALAPASAPTRLPSRLAPAAGNLGCDSGSGAEPQHRSPAGNFFFGTVTFGKKSLRKFHP